MRELKFRVWDKSINKFLWETKNEHFKSFNLWGWAERMSNCLIFPIDNLIFQQYIGTKDNFKTDIYEGDIVKNGAGRNFIVEWTYLSFEFREIEKLNDDTIYMDRIISNIGDISKYCKVIGNIFENPDLLK